MGYKNLKILILLLLILPLCLKGQKLMNKTLFSQINKPKEKEQHRFKIGQNRNEVEGTATLLFTTYKKYVSPQDMSSCVFQPTCSAYAMQAIQNDNIFVAYVTIFDRLTRCHPIVKAGQYPFNTKTGLYYDPIP